MRYIIITRKTLLKIGIILICAVFAVVMAAAFSGGSASLSASQKKLPIYRVQKENKVAAFSFDAAWGSEDTEELIAIFNKYNVKATFFLVGKWVDKYPESVKALSDAGHEIANHSDTHAHMPELSKTEMSKEILDCNEKIKAITGKTPTLFRAPYGEYCDSLIDVLSGHNMYCIQWDVDSHDWMDKTVDYIQERVTSKVKPGSIVLFHNAAANTPASLPGIIEKLQQDGYTFSTVSDLIYKGDFYLDHTGMQIPQGASPGITSSGSLLSQAGSSSAQ